MKVLIRFYGLWEALLPRIVRLPVRPDCSLDLVPVDWVASAIADLVRRDDVIGRSLHLASGAEAATIGELVAMTCDHFGVARLKFVSPDGPIRHLGRAARPLLARVAPRLTANAKLMLAYTKQNPRFDTRVARSLGLSPPRIADYFDRLVGFAYERDFGAAAAP
jgi:hypothetical protein